MTPLLHLTLLLTTTLTPSTHPTTIHPATPPTSSIERSTTPMPNIPVGGGQPPIYRGPGRATARDRIGTDASNPTLPRSGGYPNTGRNPITRLTPNTITEHTNRPR